MQTRAHRRAVHGSRVAYAALTVLVAGCGTERPPWSGFELFPADAGPVARMTNDASQVPDVSSVEEPGDVQPAAELDPVESAVTSPDAGSQAAAGPAVTTGTSSPNASVGGAGGDSGGSAPEQDPPRSDGPPGFDIGQLFAGRGPIPPIPQIPGIPPLGGRAGAGGASSFDASVPVGGDDPDTVDSGVESPNLQRRSP